MTTTDWRAWIPDAVAAAIVAALGLYEAATTWSVPWLLPDSRVQLAFVAVGTAVAVGLSRRLPAAALGLVWAVCGLQLLVGIDLMLVQVTIAAVAFGTARWGSVATVWLSALSIPIAALLVTVMVNYRGLGGLADLAGNRGLLDAVRDLSMTWQLAVAVMGAATLGAPWLVGLALRYGDRARVSKASQQAAEEDTARAVRETGQAREIARLREEQARLATDVHDVVGHSLAVILAQAESAQYLDDDPQALKDTMAKIATSARTSLRDVRQVLADTQQPAAQGASLDTLVDGVRASGHEVVSSEVGTPRPLPPELEVVAFRVLQEMLTNAIKHGRRDSPVHVERHWEGELRVEVRNVVDPSPFAPPGGSVGGAGLDGMRRRLESVGGRLDVRRREDSDGATFTATAWVPVRRAAHDR